MTGSPAAPTSAGDALVVVPTLGIRPALLARTLSSIDYERRLYPGLEVCVVTTPSAFLAVRQIIAPYSATVAVEESPGAAAAINRGWAEHSQNKEWLAWIGDDDTFCPGAVSRAIAALSSDDSAVWTFGWYLLVDEGGKLLEDIRPTATALWFMQRGFNMIGQPGSFYRAAAVKRVGFLSTDLRFAFDVDLHMKLLGQGAGVAVKAHQARARWADDCLSVEYNEASLQELVAVTDGAIASKSIKRAFGAYKWARKRPLTIPRVVAQPLRIRTRRRRGAV